LLSILPAQGGWIVRSNTGVSALTGDEDPGVVETTTRAIDVVIKLDDEARIHTARALAFP
jgi:hypothetical protein